ncbi:hypothetical protein DDK22_25685 [Cupriavidus necator]|uniref:Uncharacterized protein n=1 Tax=Cupriavidus necator TaxID=106590 RepID=A0A367PDK9_CUPNE|nr:hypothetical protein DDK22_25685 [Cupriavidus necator]
MQVATACSDYSFSTAFRALSFVIPSRCSFQRLDVNADAEHIDLPGSLHDFDVQSLVPWRGYGISGKSMFRG